MHDTERDRSAVLRTRAPSPDQVLQTHSNRALMIARHLVVVGKNLIMQAFPVSPLPFQTAFAERANSACVFVYTCVSQRTKNELDIGVIENEFDLHPADFVQHFFSNGSVASAVDFTSANRT